MTKPRTWNKSSHPRKETRSTSSQGAWEPEEERTPGKEAWAKLGQGARTGRRRVEKGTREGRKTYQEGAKDMLGML